jgi:hypothetical protein
MHFFKLVVKSLLKFLDFSLVLWCRQFVEQLAYKHAHNILCVILKSTVIYNKNTNIETPKYLLH